MIRSSVHTSWVVDSTLPPRTRGLGGHLGTFRPNQHHQVVPD